MATYKGYTKEQGKRITAYLKENREEVRFWVKKGEKDILKAAAAARGMSLAQFIISAVNERCEMQLLTPAQKEE